MLSNEWNRFLPRQLETWIPHVTLFLGGRSFPTTYLLKTFRTKCVCSKCSNQAPKKKKKKEHKQLYTQLFGKLSHSLFLYSVVIFWASILESIISPTHNTYIHTHTQFLLKSCSSCISYSYKKTDFKWLYFKVAGPIFAALVTFPGSRKATLK